MASLLLSQASIYEISSYRIDQSRLVLSPSEKIDESLLCCICQDIPFKPEECTICQNIFCSDCIRAWIDKKSKCPFDCPTPFSSTKPHKLIRQALLNLKYHCKNQENGCEEVINLESLEKHEAKCGFAKVKCPFSSECSKELFRKDCEEHHKICEFALIGCEKCMFEIQRKKFESHNCILFLKDKFMNLEKNFEIYKENHDKQLETLMKKLEELELSVINSQQKKPLNLPQNSSEKVCPRGHVMSWSMGGEILQCNLCNKKKVFSRFICKECNIKCCIFCVYPFLGEKKCPLGHEMVKCSKLVFHSCDLCRKVLDNEQEVYRDANCDLDVCGDCFVKSCK